MPELEEVPGLPWELFNIELTARDLVTAEEICRRQEEDTETKEAIRQIQESGHVSSGKFRKLNNIQLNKGLLKKGRRIIVPEALQMTVVVAYHSQSHPGVDNTLLLLKSRFYWRGMDNMVENMVKNCCTCLKCKNPRLPKAEMRLDEETDLKPQDRISVDVASMAPSPSGKTCFLVMVDVVTKFHTTVACKNQHAETVIRALWS